MTFPTAGFDSEELTALRAALGGRYVVERELGRGGMGVVYLAREKSLDRLVALKVLPGTLMGQSVLRDRFLRETRLVANMSHPNVVPIYAVEEHPGVIFYAMGFIDGESLTERVRRAGPLPPGEVARVLQEAAWALSYAHSRSVVHRDVKPDNILIERATGRALLLDFGISKVADSTMTSLGETLGTPQFMSPEQAAGESADARSDLYSLGLVGFFALTGRAPFDAPTVQGILAMQVTRPAPAIALARPGTPRGLASAIDRCLAKAPNDRWPSADALVEALQRARGVSVQEIAPPVRNFQRVAEMTLTTVITLFLLLPVVMIARPEAADILAVIICIFTAINLLQLASNARRLRDQGFAYEDVRAAFDADARIMRDASVEVMSRRQHPVQRFVRDRFPVLLGIGVAMFGAGAVLAGRMHARTTIGLVPAGLILGGALLILVIAILRAFSGDIGRGANRFAVALWRTAAGRFFFRVAAPAKGAGAAGAAAPQPSGLAALLVLRDLPAALRRQLGDAPRVVARLERAVSALEMREVELDRALADVESAGGGADAAALARDRASLTHDLERARDGVIAHRDALTSELEHLRLSFVRIRAGVGTAADARAALDRARAAVLAADPQRQPPNGLVVPAAESRPV